MMEDNNVTTEISNNATTFEDVYNQWLACMVISFIFIGFIFYVIIALTYFTIKRHVCRKIISGSSESLIKASSAMVLILSYALCFSTLLHFISLLPLINIQEEPLQEPFCLFYHRFSTTMAGVSFGCSCFALWFRVYAIFYRHPFIRSTMSWKVRFLSKSAVVYLLLAVVVNLFAFLSAPPYETDPVGCRRTRSSSHTTIKWGLLISTFALFQVTLFFLLVYPLVRHRKQTLSLGNESTNIIPIIKRGFFTALVCVLSNAFTALFGIVSKETFTYMRHLVYGTNFVICLIALICFSADWRERLSPCYLNHVLKNRIRNRSTNQYRISANVTTISKSYRVNYVGSQVKTNARGLSNGSTNSCFDSA